MPLHSVSVCVMWGESILCNYILLMHLVHWEHVQDVDCERTALRQRGRGLSPSNRASLSPGTAQFWRTTTLSFRIQTTRDVPWVSVRMNINMNTFTNLGISCWIVKLCLWPPKSPLDSLHFCFSSVLLIWHLSP